eukprot:43383-Rhodomonas_salina.1
MERPLPRAHSSNSGTRHALAQYRQPQQSYTAGTTVPCIKYQEQQCTWYTVRHHRATQTRPQYRAHATTSVPGVS